MQTETESEKETNPSRLGNLGGKKTPEHMVTSS
jgi:hypothetical protein